jgi:hypothetical protein
VILNDDESQLWEIDYDRHAANVSAHLDLLKHDSIVNTLAELRIFFQNKDVAKTFIFMKQWSCSEPPIYEICNFETHS